MSSGLESHLFNLNFTTKLVGDPWDVGVFLDYRKRSFELSQEYLGTHQQVGRCLDLTQKTKILGRGTFKNAFKMPVWDPEQKSVAWWCVKYPNGTLREWVPDVVLLKDECTIGQIGSLIFYEMRKRLRQNGKDTLDIHFNRPILAPLNIVFYGPQMDELMVSSHATLVMVEHLIAGGFQHHLGQFGHLPSDTEISLFSAAFSHFSYVYSRGRLVITDVQGSADRFTDVCIHTIDGTCGYGDFGLDGMRCCGHIHECNKYCEALGIQDDKMEVKVGGETAADFDVDRFAKQFSTTIQRGILYRPFKQQIPSLASRELVCQQQPQPSFSKRAALSAKSYLASHFFHHPEETNQHPEQSENQQ